MTDLRKGVPPGAPAALEAATLCALVSAGKVAVEFGPRVEDLESYPEPGMRAHILQAAQQPDDILKLEVTYSEYDTFNRTRETANYYDERGNPTMTARQAGEYRVEEEIFLPAEGDLSAYLTLLDDRSVRRMAAFRDSGHSNYLAWLEGIADAYLAEKTVEP